MPTNTFEGLPAAKKKRLMRAFWDEFSQHSYADSSINRMIQSANIPRGSFYQYFVTKEDLFLYILETIETNTQELLFHLLQVCQNDLSCALVQLFDKWYLQPTVPTFSEFQKYRMLRLNPMLDWQLRLSKQNRSLLSSFQSCSRRSPSQLSENQQALLLCFFANTSKRAFFHPEEAVPIRQELIYMLDMISQINPTRIDPPKTLQSGGRRK